MDGSATAIDIANEYQVSRYNVIGIFLALQLCQITQPFGSLLFRGHGGIFWRCNPLASFVEACIIYWNLAVTIWECRRQKRPVIVARLQDAAAGLLLLRGVVGTSSAGALIESLLAGSFDDEVSLTSVPPPTDITRRGHTSSSRVTSGRHPTVSRQPTLEALRLNLDTASPEDRDKVLREAFSANAMAHKELRIDIFTACAEISILVKLTAIRGAGCLQAGGIFLVFGWFAVQVLLFLLHARELRDLEMTASVRAARTINTKLKTQESNWIYLFAILHLPFFIYPAYLAAFRPWFAEDVGGLLGWLRDAGEHLTYVFSIIGFLLPWLGFFGVATLIIIIFAGDGSFWHRIISLELLGISIITPVSMWLELSAMAYLNMECVRRNTADECPLEVSIFFRPDTPLRRHFDNSFPKVYQATWLVVYVTIMSLVYFGVTLGRGFTISKIIQAPTSGAVRGSSLGNAGFVLIAFVLYLIWYDPSVTYKPPWTEILG